MKELVNISDQQFYYFTIDQVIEECSERDSCAIIVDEIDLDELLKKGEETIEKYVSQIIIISENVNVAASMLEGVSVLLIAAESFEEAIRVVILGEALIKEVVCIPKEGKNVVGKFIDII